MNYVLELSTTHVADVATAWQVAKMAERQANSNRLQAEQTLIALLGQKEEGAQTHRLPDGRTVTITAKLTRELDEAQYRAIAVDIPAHLRPVNFVEVPKLDLKGLRWLEENDTKTYALVAQALTVKPAKTTVDIK